MHSCSYLIYCTVVQVPHTIPHIVPHTSFRMLPSDKFILNYHDAILYESDIELLTSETEWLNDACIHFYMTVLQQRYPRVKFIDPSVVTFLMHQCDDEDMQEFSSSFDKGYSAYVVPINDGHKKGSFWQEVGCGSHWSVLLIRSDFVYVHADSVSGKNAQAALAVAEKMSIVFGHNKFISVTELRTPQQHNGYDCGIHTLAAAEILAGAECGSIKFYEELLGNAKLAYPGFGREMRREVLAMAVELSRDWKRSR